MSIHINGEMSKEFPLYHTKLIPIYKPLKKRPYYPPGKKTKEVNFYTNEHPDFFRLDGMKINGYKNPYLDEVIKVDRNEQFIKMNSNAEQINLIDYIKSNRKLSQDPNILKVIKSEFDIQMHQKRQQISEDRKKPKQINKYSIKLDDIKNYDTIIKELDNYTPRINYKMKQTIDPHENTKYIGKYLTSEENYNKLKQITCQYNPLKSAYITNCNDYKISEAYGRDKQKELTHKRRSLNRFNLINYKKEKMTPPLNTNEKWSQFYENYYMTMFNNKKGFSQKGGLFTEFTNKNIGVINVNKRNNKEKLLRENKDYKIRNLIFGKNNAMSRNKNNLTDLSKKTSSIIYNFVGLNRPSNFFGSTMQ